jgi:hypothetical protein
LPEGVNVAIPEDEPHVRALQAVLVGAGLNVGIADAPAGTNPPYVVLWPLVGGLDGSLGDHREVLVLRWQISAVGAGAEQAVQQADRARSALMAGPIAVAGRVVHAPLMLDGQPVRRDDETQPARWVATAQYEARSDPA